MGIVRTLSIGIAVIAFAAASCCPESATTGAAPLDQPAPYGAAKQLGGSTRQWSVLINVDALIPSVPTWWSQSCTNDVSESTRRQHLFAKRLDVALTAILVQSPHCSIASITVLAYGKTGCNNADTSNPSGAYAVFSCPSGEPLVTHPRQ